VHGGLGSASAKYEVEGSQGVWAIFDLSHCALLAPQGRARAPARRINLLPPAFAPSAEALATIVTMGFAEPHARAALAAVGSNSIELGMEWLLTHPPEEAEEPEPDAELAAAMSLSLSTGGRAHEALGDAESLLGES
jgi:hypothetical protein